MSLIGDLTLVVTGFPRSGTSMMMRMLHFGGIEIVASEKYMKPVSDVDPYGAFELEGVEEIKEHPIAWTQGKAIKIVTPYFRWLPIDRPLKCIFMLRDKNEIITSLLAQHTLWEEDIGESVNWARGYLQYMDIPTLYMKYQEVMNYPKTAAVQIEDFLEVPLNKEEMAKAVDKNARHRLTNDPSVPHIKQPVLLRLDGESHNELQVGVYHGPGQGVDYVFRRTAGSGSSVPEETEGVRPETEV